MDKKKVIKLIKKGMLYQSKSSHVSSYKEKAKNCFNEALDELQKSDWISVEDELPPYNEWVLVGNKEYPYSILMSKRLDKLYVDYTKIDYSIDPNGFAVLSSSISITHWRKIDKLEV